MADEHNFTFCATDWAGMATYDIPNVATILADLSNFNTLADRVQQGMLNFLMLGRLMIHADGLCKQAAFQVDGKCVLDTRELFYDGNSQGGIIGGALAAVAVDHDRAVLGVPGMNYSTLLRRSKDWGTGKQPDGLELPEYAWFNYQSYPNELERPLTLSLIQMLWDRAEANGYAHHMTSDPLPNTPPHEVLLHVGLGDHQVAQVTAEVEARTIGAHARTPYADPGRDLDREPHFGIPAIPGYPFAGSAVVMWDIGPLRPPGECDDDLSDGTPPPPNGNVPPRCGTDPHEYPRREPGARLQKSEFMRPGGR